MAARRSLSVFVSRVSLLAIVCWMSFGSQAHGKQVQEVKLVPGEKIALKYPQLGVDRTGAVTKMLVRLPSQYSPKETYPLIVWLGGGGGRPNLGPPMKLVDKEQWVVVSLPYPRGANDPYQSNMVGNFPRIWQYHRAMLADLLRRVPNISPSVRYVVGFSNGGHCIDGLLSRAGQEPASFYSGFVLVDGGGARGTGRYHPAVAGKQIYVLWGGRSVMRRYSPNVVRAARAAGMAVSFHQMHRVGHAFPTKYKQLVADWIDQTAGSQELLDPPPIELAVGLSIMQGVPSTVASGIVMRQWHQRRRQWLERRRQSAGHVSGFGQPK